MVEETKCLLEIKPKKWYGEKHLGEKRIFTINLDINYENIVTYIEEYRKKLFENCVNIL